MDTAYRVIWEAVHGVASRQKPAIPVAGSPMPGRTYHEVPPSRRLWIWADQLDQARRDLRLPA